MLQKTIRVLLLHKHRNKGFSNGSSQCSFLDIACNYNMVGGKTTFDCFAESVNPSSLPFQTSCGGQSPAPRWSCGRLIRSTRGEENTSKAVTPPERRQKSSRVGTVKSSSLCWNVASSWTARCSPPTPCLLIRAPALH